MSDTSSKRHHFDRSIVEGPITKAVWKLAWPTMLQNMIGGLQGIIDHVMVGHYVGYVGNAAIGVSLQIFLVVVVFVSSLYMGMAVLVARFTGANEPEKVNRTVYQAFLTSVVLAVGILAPLGCLFAPSLLDLVRATPEVKAEALPYLRIMFVFSMGATAAVAGQNLGAGKPERAIEGVHAAAAIIREHEAALLEAWHDYFHPGNRNGDGEAR